MSDVTLLSGISGLSFDSPFLSSLLLFFCLVLLLFLLMVHSPDFFSLQKTQIFFGKVRLFCISLVEQLGDDTDSW